MSPSPAWAPDAYPHHRPPLSKALREQKRADCKRAVEEVYDSEVKRRLLIESRSMRRMALGLYKGASANDVASHLSVPGARRAGNGAAKGSWSGYMSPGLRVQSMLRQLVKDGELGGGWSGGDSYRWYFWPVDRPPYRLTLEEE